MHRGVTKGWGPAMPVSLSLSLSQPHYLSYVLSVLIRFGPTTTNSQLHRELTPRSGQDSMSVQSLARDKEHQQTTTEYHHASVHATEHALKKEAP